MKNERYDFSGWATRNDIKCSDGRIIRKDAFKGNDGKNVPLVWNHDHNDPLNVLGHALLENRDEGVYVYGTFNDTEQGQNAKELVKHGDITSLSIWANQLTQRGSDVLHGAIKEVSLVLAGANPGAYIESIMAHGEESDDEAIIFSGDESLSLYHADEEEAKKPEKVDSKTPAAKKEDDLTIQDVFNSMTEEQKEAVYALIGQAVSGEEPDDADEEDKDEVEHSDTKAKGKTIKEIFDSMNEQQKNVAYFLIGQALEDTDESEIEQSDSDEDYIQTNTEEGGNTVMKHNVFEKEEQKNDVLTHSEMETIINDAKKFGSMKESFLAHADEFGIDNVEYLFPDVQNVTRTPEFIKRDTGWVSKVMGAVHKTPFSRIRSIFADITADDARAKGYIKGKLKKEEVFSLLKRTTSPTTIYKKQKMHRDDVIDITDFDVVAWLKAEMRLMLDEEIARAVLIGDGRLASDDDHIDANCIRPVFNDADLYTIKTEVNVASAATDDDVAKEFIKQVIKSRKEYKGSGNPTLYTTEDMLTNMLLLTDLNGRDMYESVEKLATKLRVKEIVTVEPMEGLKDANNNDVLGVVVNLADYNVGADKGGAINMFDDFDIDYNQQKYLMETRCSGALIKPYSAITLTLKRAS